MDRHHKHWGLSLGSALALCACTGTIGDSEPRAGATVDVPGLGVPVAGADAPGVPPAGGDPAQQGAPGLGALTCTTPAVGPSPLRRLTHAEYDNSVRDLLGDTTRPGASFAPDTQVGLFDNAVEAQTVSVLLADQYLQSALDLAETADLDTVIGCDRTDATCVRAFVERFGRRAYRRPLTAAESDGLVALYDEARLAADADTGVRGTIAAMLSSPNFLFRPEFGAAEASVAGAKALTGFELAGRLASLVWGSVPDDALLDAAQAGALTREALPTEARRMLADPKAREHVVDFYAQWFGLPLLETATKDAAVYPSFDDAMRDAMREETRRFVEHVLWNDDATLTTLLTAPYSILNQPLAALYGVSGPTSADVFVKTDLDPVQRLGVLTQASLMTTFASPGGSSPIKRGKLVRVRLLCQELPDPPANVPPPPAPQQGVSTRERFAMHTSDPGCAGCHNLIDGLGFGLEHYDGTGAYRTMDHGVPVDASGEVTSTQDIDGPYMGGPELASLLAESAQVRDCAPTQWLRYALARTESEDDACSLVALRDAFAASGGNLGELVVALTQTDAFSSYRAPE